MATIICPYVFPEEIALLQDKLWNLDCIFEQDVSRIGSDMMYQKLWKQTKDDIIILHADMQPLEHDTNNQWYDDLINYNGSIKTIGYLLIKLKLSSLEMGICLLCSYYMNCQKEMIIIAAILETCKYRLNDLFTDNNAKKVNKIFKKSIVEHSDHITLLNIYIDM